MSGVVPLPDLLQCLVSSSEKAARIARAFRVRDDLFGLVVEEKSEIEKNRLRVQDFKTLADVLVQETIKRDVAKKFPALSSRIQGEEQNSFQNTLGESIRVELTDSLDETSALLCRVLDGKVTIAESLAATVHSSCDDSEVRRFGGLDSSSATFPTDRLGIWIDPIDSTAEYIQAKQNGTDQGGIALYGLTCVSVLIGVYDLQTGLPVMGIINQPFYREVDGASRWESNIYWGISCDTEAAISTSTRKINNGEKKMRKVVVTSFFEDKQLQSILQSKYDVVHTAGAGYKCLVVAKGLAEMYVLSLHNTHFWDTCGPHAILAAQGGGIVNFQQTINSGQVIDHSNLRDYQLRYLEDSTNPGFNNKGGIVAYRDPEDLFELLELIQESGYHYGKSE